MIWRAAMIVGGGTLTFNDAVAVPEKDSAREAVFLLSRTGKVHVEAGRNGQTFRLWRDIDVHPSESLTLDVPKGDAVLKGSMRTYDGGLGFAEHGWAGPRMQLIADDPQGWSVTEFLPARDGRDGTSKDTFTTKELPSGAYHLYQHLIGKQETYTYDGKEHQYIAPVSAWGGIPVKLEPGGTTQLQDFVEYPFQALNVHVVDRIGRAIENATVRIRDRMSESWRQVEENPAQLEQAAHPIPYPPAARLAGGNATLPSVGTGWLDISVELDDGAVYGFTVPVSPPKELTLTVPAEVR